MLIQCADGKFYKDPLWAISDDKIITPTELGYRLKRTHSPKWDHVRRGLPDFGIKNEGGEEHTRLIFGERLCDAIIYKIKLTSAPPVPSQHSGCVDDPAGADDEVIRF